MRVNKILLVLIVGIFSNQLSAQKYFSKTGGISFFSKTPIENIEAVSNTASTVFDLESGKVQWAVLIKSFEFEKSLMQEHFNENYMESNTFPKAKFSGTIEDAASLDLKTDGTYTANISGELTIHGVTQKVNTTATFTVASGTITGNSALNVKVADYDIKIPGVVRKNIAENIDITIEANYELLDR